MQGDEDLGRLYCGGRFMEIWYDSFTGNVRHFVKLITRELAISAHDLKTSTHQPATFLLITYTFDQGGVPASTTKFLHRYAHALRGVVSSGSYHWGPHFARAADHISQKYEVPIVAKINKRGTKDDVSQVVSWLRKQ